MFHPSVSDGYDDGPHTTSNKTSPQKDKRNNQINILYPYRMQGGIWVYDDPDIPVYREAFVLGSSELIDHLVGKDAKTCVVYFSSKLIPQFTIKLRNIDKELIDTQSFGEKGWYINEDTQVPNWFCGHLLDYFNGYPEEIYIKIEKTS